MRSAKTDISIMKGVERSHKETISRKQRRVEVVREKIESLKEYISKLEMEITDTSEDLKWVQGCIGNAEIIEKHKTGAFKS